MRAKKRRKSTYRKKMKRKIRSFQLMLGCVVTLIAALGAAGFFLFSSRAMDELKFVTNAGTALNGQGSSWKVMDGAQAYIEGTSADTEIYYKFYSAQLSDTSGLVLKTEGTKYTAGQAIAMSSSIAEEGSCYLYVQQFSGEESRLDSYQISFLDKADAVTVSPATSDTQMTTLKAGDVLRFAGSGTLYYTVDGTSPTFSRAANGASGDVQVNGEAFVMDNSSIQKMGTGNTLTVPASWISQETLTIRVISCTDGKDFSAIATFRYTLGKEQAQTPTIAPQTTAESPVTVPDGTTATLSTSTADGVILYTLDQTVPTYTIGQDSTSGQYTLSTGSTTYVYSDRITVTGKPGAEFVITALTIKYTPEDGEVMKASDPVQFVYKFADLETAQAPEGAPKSGSVLALGDAVYLNTATSGGVILYTLDGTSPTYEWDEDTKQIVLGASTIRYGETASYILADEENGASAGGSFLIQAKTISIDQTTGEKLMEDSAVVQFSYTISDLETVTAPTATPATTESKPTVVEEGDTILLSTTTSGAKIYYTTDGSAPVLDENKEPANSATKLYEGSKAFTVPAGSGYLTITAFAVKEDMNDSSVVQFVYQYPQIVAPPYCMPAEGTVTINTEVELASLDKDALIYYTLDGSNPTAVTGKLYTDPLLLTESVTIKAICILDGISSSVRTFNFTVSPVLQPPVPSISSGAVITSGTTLTLTAANGAEILYTTDGSNPKSGSPLSGDTVTITGSAGETVTLITYAKGADYSDSQTATYVYTISNYENGIYVNPESGTKVSAGDIIRLETDVTNGTIYYAVGGDVPDKDSERGNQVLVPEAAGEETFLLKAVAVPTGSSFPNAVGSYQYPYLIELASPKASIPDQAVLLREQEVTLTAQEGDIYYTLDGTVPDEYASLYAEAIKVDSPVTIQAFAMNEDGAKSNVSIFRYSFADSVSAPQFSVQGGEVETGTTLTLRSDTVGATIYYTTDGQVPDPENPNNLYTYSGAITITKPVHIKAIAAKERMTSSEVVSATFTVKEVQPETSQTEEEEKSGSGDGSRLMSRRSFMDSGSGPTYTDFILKHAMTGIVLSAKEGTVPVDAQIEVTQIAVDDALNRSVRESAGSESGAIAAYEVSITQNGAQIVLEEDVEVGFPIPEKYQNSAIYIASVDEEGNVDLFDTRRDGDMAYVFTDRFGRFCIVGTVDLGQEEKSFNYGILIAGCTLMLLAAGYLLLRRAGKKGEADE